MPGLRDPFFKGCTRPAMFAGVPMIPFVVFSGFCVILAVWVFYLVSRYATLLVILAYIPSVMWMRQVTKKDDQRLRQLLMRSRMRVRQQAGRALWGAVSYSPLRFKRRKAS